MCWRLPSSLPPPLCRNPRKTETEVSPPPNGGAERERAATRPHRGRERGSQRGLGECPFAAAQLCHRASRLAPREPTVPAGKLLPSSVEGLGAPPSPKEGQAAREPGSHWTAAGKRSCFPVNRGLPRSPLSAIDCTREREREPGGPGPLKKPCAYKGFWGFFWVVH